MMAKQRPQARTANELRSFLERGHERLVGLDGEHVAWLGSSAELGQALGIKRQAMTSRLRTLRSAQVADTSDARRIVFDLGRLTELATGVRHLRLAESTQQFRSAVSETFEEQRSADGGVAYRHRDTGQRASVRDLTRVAGYDSPSSTQYHLKVLADTSDKIVQEETEQPSSGQQTRPLTDALTELSSLLAATDSSDGLQATVLDAIAAVSRSGRALLTGEPSSFDVSDASSSRGSRHDDALTRVDHDFEISKSMSVRRDPADATRTPTARVEPRDKDASSTRRPHLPADRRQLGGPNPLSHEQLASIFAPLVEAVSRTHPTLTPNWVALASAAAPWPSGDLSSAIAKLVTQLDSSSPSSECHIENPYAVFSAAAKRGDLEYFELRPERGDHERSGAPGRTPPPVATIPSVSQVSLRSCLIADLERSDRSAAIDALVGRCKVADDPEVLIDVARRVVLEVSGEEGADYFDQRIEVGDPPATVEPSKLSKDEREAILGTGRAKLPR